MINRITTHIGDPCIFCNVDHDDVPPGPCCGRQSSAMYYDAVKELSKRTRRESYYLLPLEAQAVLDELRACHYRADNCR